MIQNLQNQQDTAMGQRVASSPANENIGTTLQETANKITSGSPVPQMQQGADSALQSLFEFDKSIEGSYDTPIMPQAQEMYGQDYYESPATYGRGAMGNIAGQAGNVESLFNTISAFKSLEGSTLNNALGTILGYVQSQEQRRQAEEDRKWEREKFEKQMALENQKLSSGGGSTATERQTNQLRENMARDAQSGMTIKDMMAKYRSVADFNDVLDIYSGFSTWGPPKEGVEDLRKIYEAKTVDTAKTDEKTAKALQAVSLLEQLYGRGDSSTVGTGKDLSRGRNIFSRVGEIVPQIREKFGGKSELMDDVRSYQAQLEAATGLFSQAMGSGTPQEAEALRYIKSAPSLKSSDR